MNKYGIHSDDNDQHYISDEVYIFPCGQTLGKLHRFHLALKKGYVIL